MMLANATEEMALPLKGKRSNFNLNIFFDYFGEERLGLNRKVLANINDAIGSAVPEWINLIEISFLSDKKKQDYLKLVNNRKRLMGG